MTRFNLFETARKILCLWQNAALGSIFGIDRLQAGGGFHAGGTGQEYQGITDGIEVERLFGATVQRSVPVRVVVQRIRAIDV